MAKHAAHIFLRTVLTAPSNIRLIIMTVIVHAKSSGVCRYIFAGLRWLPIELRLIPITSAAIPDFHASPIPVEKAEERYGRRLGI